MGCLFTVLLPDDGSARLETAASEALDRIGWLEAQLSHYRPDSDISLINAYAYGEPVPVTDSLFALLLRLRELSEAADGVFDPTIGRLLRRWGLLQRGATAIDVLQAPPDEELASLVQQTGWRNIALDERRRTVRFLTPAVELNLGACGKGLAVQCAADYLRSLGIEAALVSGGDSSIAAIGAPHGEAGWPVGLPNAAAPDTAASSHNHSFGGDGLGDMRGEVRTSLASAAGGQRILLRDETLSTTGSEGVAVMAAGERRSHICDPRTGMLVALPGPVCVLAQDALQGDALSTAFALQGQAWASAVCARRPDIGARFASAGSIVEVGAFAGRGVE